MFEVILLQAARDYLNGLPVRDQGKIDSVIARLALEGPDLRRPHADVVRGKIRELRCGLGRKEHRLLYFFEGRRVIVTQGFLKKTDKLPERELVRAESIYRIYHEKT